MQYVWLHRLWPPGKMFTNDGLPVAVIDVGQLNRDAGPDFFNAKVRIGGEMWCGNVEFHVRASDWHRHGHDRDRAYDSVILHVVEYDDCAITTSDGTRVIPQLVLRCARDFADRYAAFVGNQANTLACAGSLRQLEPVMVRDWLDSLAYERLYAKVDAIRARLERTAGNWEQTAFITLARALGAGINGDAFERVAASLPLRLLHKHSDSLLSLEAMLLGQAGLLGGSSGPYGLRLSSEYGFLADKFGLRPPQGIAWRMSRMRPASFPHRRLAVLAAMVNGGFRLMQRILEVNSENDARELFRFDLTGFWADHCSLTAAAGSASPRALGASTVDMLVVNVVAPMLLAYADAIGDDDPAARAVDILEHLPAESNRFTRDFVAAGVACQNAFVSQAMIQAHTAYCDVRKCLHCRLGHRLLAARVTP